MSIRRIAPGQDFFTGGDHFAEMKDFGFAGSMQGYESHPEAPPFVGDKPQTGPHTSVETTPGYSHGGMHKHPHGHHLTHVKHHPDGTVIHHHAHGGYTVHHTDGNVSHHDMSGAPIQPMTGGMPMGAQPEGTMMHAHGGIHHAGTSHPHGHNVSHVEHTRHGEIEHHSHGGYSMHHHDGHTTHHAADGSPAHMKHMAESAVHQHEDHEHGGEHTALHLARGGMPHGMLHKGKSMHPLNEGSALNQPPHDPRQTRTPRNQMPGGQMGYGMEPSDQAGNMPTASEEGMDGNSGMTQMRRGGMHKAAKGGHHKGHKRK